AVANAPITTSNSSPPMRGNFHSSDCRAGTRFIGIAWYPGDYCATKNCVALLKCYKVIILREGNFLTLDESRSEARGGLLRGVSAREAPDSEGWYRSAPRERRSATAFPAGSAGASGLEAFARARPRRRPGRHHGRKTPPHPRDD